MTRRLFLPRGPEAAPGPMPTVEQMRHRLGGQYSPTRHRPVRVAATGAVGVVLSESDDAIDVLQADRRVRRTRPEGLEACSAVPATLRSSLDALAVFGALAEGDDVHFEDATTGTVAEGRLVEKCRWGGLVLRQEDDAILAVGFAKIWPAVPTGGPTS